MLLAMHLYNLTLCGFDFVSDQASAMDVFVEVVDGSSPVQVFDTSDPDWPRTVLSNTMPRLFGITCSPSSQDPPTVLSLQQSQYPYRTVKLNSEAVRGLWASAQQELFYFGNTDSERPSIQSHKSILRNLIVSGADSPVGYPAYVSPLVTAFFC